MVNVSFLNKKKIVKYRHLNFYNRDFCEGCPNHKLVTFLIKLSMKNVLLGAFKLHQGLKVM
jgi:hypothetical protein